MPRVVPNGLVLLKLVRVTRATEANDGRGDFNKDVELGGLSLYLVPE